MSLDKLAPVTDNELAMEVLARSWIKATGEGAVEDRLAEALGAFEIRRNYRFQFFDYR